jgi:SIT4-associating protein SAP185/190
VQGTKQQVSHIERTNLRLVTYLSKEDSVKTLLQWVICDLDKLDEEAVMAESACHTAHDPSYRSGPGPPPSNPVDDDFLSNIQDINLERQSDSNPSRYVLSTRKLIRYPQIATEILTSELWTISETVMSHKDTLLTPFWDAVLPDVPSRVYESEKEQARDEFWSDADEERDRKREIIRGLWTRVNGALMQKRTHEVGEHQGELTVDDPFYPIPPEYRSTAY